MIARCCNSWKFLVAMGLTLSASLPGCGARDAGQTDNKTVSGTQKTAPTAPQAAAVTDEECQALANQINAAIAKGDVAEFSKIIDWEGLFRTGTEGIQVSEKIRKSFIEGAMTSISRKGSLVPMVIEQSKNGGSYTFLRIHHVNKRKSVLFRLLLKEGGVNYHDFVVGHDATGKLRAVDLYIYLTGELLSQTMRRLYIPAAAHASRGLLAKVTGLSGPEQEFVDNLPKFSTMTDSLNARKPQEVLDAYQQMPASLQADKTVMILRYQAAQLIGGETYSKAMEEFRKQHPNDASVDIIFIDYNLMKKDYAEALACIGRLEKALGGDRYLDVMRAGIYVESEKLDEGRAALLKAIEQEPTLELSYASLLDLSLRSKNFDDTVNMFEALENKFHVRFTDLRKVPEYAEFVASPQYKKWQAQKSKTPDSADDGESQKSEPAKTK